VPGGKAQNVLIALTLLALGGFTLLTAPPLELGTIRLAGVSLLWWFGALVVPVLTLVSLAVVVLARRPAPPA
jgi:hypothetical protein